MTIFGYEIIKKADKDYYCSKIEELEKDNGRLKDKVDEASNINTHNIAEWSRIESDYLSKIADLVKENCELENEIEIKNAQIEDLKSDRYLRRTVRATKAPKQKMKVRSTSKESAIVKRIHED